MTEPEKFTITSTVRIEPDLLIQIKKEAEKLDTDVYTYIRWCIRIGLYLEDLNKFIRSRIGEEFD